MPWGGRWLFSGCQQALDATPLAPQGQKGGQSHTGKAATVPFHPHPPRVSKGWGFPGTADLIPHTGSGLDEAAPWPGAQAHQTDGRVEGVPCVSMSLENDPASSPPPLQGSGASSTFLAPE